MVIKNPPVLEITNGNTKEKPSLFEKFQLGGLVHDREEFSKKSPNLNFNDLKQTRSGNGDSFSNNNHFYKKSENQSNYRKSNYNYENSNGNSYSNRKDDKKNDWHSRRSNY